MLAFAIRSGSAEVVSGVVRMIVLIWSGAILSLSYIDAPIVNEKEFDPTFIASIFTATLTTFGVQVNGRKKPDEITQADLRRIESKINELDHPKRPTRRPINPDK